MPNPFYQIYEGAGILAGSNPYFINCFEDTNFQPNFEEVDESTWAKCELLYICTPGNPSGAVIPLGVMKHLIQLSDEHNFVIISDECYSEIYHREASPPPSILEACDSLNRSSYKNCLVFNLSLKKIEPSGTQIRFRRWRRRINRKIPSLQDLSWIRDAAVAPPICKRISLGG